GARVSSSRHHHLDATVLSVSDAPCRGSTLMAERRFGAAAQNGGHPPPLSTQLRAPDGIDTIADAVEASLRETMAYRLGAESHRQELSPGHDPVLLSRHSPRL